MCNLRYILVTEKESESSKKLSHLFNKNFDTLSFNNKSYHVLSKTEKKFKHNNQMDYLLYKKCI